MAKPDDAPMIADADPVYTQRNRTHDYDPREGSPETPLADYMDYISGAGFGRGPVLTGGAYGPGFLTWDQADFRAMRRRFGEGDPDIGNYNLNQVHFDKETGTASVAQLDVGPSGWYGTPAGPTGTVERSQGG
jgi:hypothetical protein